MEAVYLIGQTVLYVCVLYFMAGFAKDAGKFFWFTLFSLLTFLFFTYFGIACVALTPNLMVAAILSGAFYGLFNLFAGRHLPLIDWFTTCSCRLMSCMCSRHSYNQLQQQYIW